MQRCWTCQCFVRARSHDLDSSPQPEHLFRGTWRQNGMKVVIKAVHLRSREYEIIRRLSRNPLLGQPMNHCVRESCVQPSPSVFHVFLMLQAVCAFIEVSEDNIAFIVMEEWSSQLVSDRPCSMPLFMNALRQIIEV